ncbi:EAL domain-containing protein [Xanthomonas maliensis]|uniref:EAL domain-containing protein n=1 Tax=Xanthomonas maliensis TaxID=1321368 RepID=UPI0003B2E538|nr:EAL domain-containing protein [Xanthomonas maliensis]KAB7769153.1 cyclic diguanylate phosphodiesterase [Xanthomonas maliensis]
MRRRRILGITLVLALVCAAVPIGLAIHVAWRLALEREQTRLSQLAELSIRRTEAAFDEAHQALRFMGQSPLPPCSPQHLAQMRALVLSSHYIAELGYFQQRQLRCTSWGPLTTPIPQHSPDFVSRRGIAVTAHLRPLASPQHPVMALQLGSYNALVNPSALTDIDLPADHQLAVGTSNGYLLSSTGPAAAGHLVGNSTTGASNPQVLTGSATAGDWMAVATEPSSNLRGPMAALRLQLLPIGGAVAALLVAAVMWLTRRRLSPLSQLQRAVRRGDFVVHYQPIIALASGSCIGAEALVRWRGSDGSLVPPDAFIPLAEQSGLILPITDLVVATVIAELGAALAADPGLHVAINVSAGDIRSGRIQAVLSKALQGTAIRSTQLWVEATERSLMDIDAARATIGHLRGAGYTVSIDDFGTGYSSLQYLQGLPLDALKIDKSFVDTIGTHSATSSVTAHIIEMAKTLGLRTIAEGVERQEQLDYLRAHGVDLAQGWLFSRALPASEFIAYLQRSGGEHATADLQPH